MTPSTQASEYSAEEGYALCAALAKNHYENFTIGSWLLPKNKRSHIYALYAFCRYVDNLGDEHDGDRLAALDEWELDLLKCYGGTPHHPYLVALQQTIQEFDVPSEPFLKLIEANRIDQRTKRYATYHDLYNYCQYSAHPVGHMVLYVFGYRDHKRRQLSDYTCTALQLTNFWQDVSRDYAMGRIYIPVEDMESFGYSEEMLASRQFTPQFCELMAFEVTRTREMFHHGLELVGSLDGRLKLDVALFSLGGMWVLDAIQRQNYDVFSTRPTLSKRANIKLMLSTALKLHLTGHIDDL